MFHVTVSPGLAEVFPLSDNVKSPVEVLLPVMLIGRFAILLQFILVNNKKTGFGWVVSGVFQQ
jgi:hypothetical protein